MQSPGQILATTAQASASPNPGEPPRQASNSTHPRRLRDSGEGILEALPPPCTDMDQHDEVVLMAIMKPAKTMGKTTPELHYCKR
jgi:hypothetical protein